VATQQKAVKTTEYDPIAELVRVNPVPSIMIQMETLSIVVVNDAVVKLVGYSERELLGMSITELVPPEDVAAVHKASEEIPPEGETLWRCFRKDGALLYLKLKYRDTIFRGRAARFIVAIAASPQPFTN